MAADAEGTAIRDALQSGRACQATVVALHSLLHPEVPTAATKPSAARSASTNAPAASPSKARQSRAKPKKATLVTVCEDAPSILSVSQQYALAIDVVSACLKVLADALKTTRQARSKQLASPSHRALQSVSGNSTPLKSTPTRIKPLRRVSSGRPTDSCDSPSLNIAHTTECAQHAFAHLRSVDPKSIGVRELPKWQLENAMLAFAEKLMALGLDRLAVRELRHVKRRLEMAIGLSASDKKDSSSSNARPTSSQKETLATLLRLNCSQINDSDALNVAMSYHSHILRAISNTRKPALTEESVQYFDIDTPNSPISLVVRQLAQGGSSSKPLKHLEQLSKTILGLCPDIAPEADDVAKDPTQYPSPLAVFQLQELHFRIRILWWDQTRYTADLSKELLDPFWKCASALVRRSSSTHDAAAVYESIASNFENLGVSHKPCNAISLFNIHNLLCSAAEAVGRHQDAQAWAHQMVEDCAALEENHALRVVARVRQTTLLLITKNASQIDLDPILALIRSKISGNGLHYDLLLISVADLMQSLCDYGAHDGSPSAIKLASQTATFSLQYSRSYPARNIRIIRQLLDIALRFCTATEDLLSWVAPEAVTVMTNLGALGDVVELAASRPLLVAWTRSRMAVSCSRILRALTIKFVRLSAEQKAPMFFDDDKLNSAERAALLEWQLICLIDLAEKTKYHPALSRMLPQLLSVVSDLCSAARFPIRRARIAIAVLRLRESHPHLLSSQCLEPWLETSLDKVVVFGEDTELKGFQEDIKAGLAIAQLFSDGQPSTANLRSYLVTWERIIGTCAEPAQLHDRIDNPTLLIKQLNSIAAYFGMLGEDSSCLATQRLLVRVMELHKEPANSLSYALTDLARQYLQIGLSEKAFGVLTRTGDVLAGNRTSSLAQLDYHITKSEYFVVTDNVDQSRLTLDQADKLRSNYLSETVTQHDSRMYGLLHARAWLVHSKCSSKSQAPHAALAAAKQSVRIMNSLWTSLEKSCCIPANKPLIDSNDSIEPEAHELAKGVRKLQLNPKDSSPASKIKEAAEKGAAFWPLVPVICKALVQLSETYIHHGIFHEATYYSRCALQIAESVGSTALLSRVRSHRVQLLTSAGDLEDAELMLTKDTYTTTGEPSLAVVEGHCAQANLRGKAGSLGEAIALYSKAEALIAALATKESIARSDTFADGIDCLQEQMQSLSVQEDASGNIQSTSAEARRAIKTRKAPPTKAKQRQIADHSAAKPASARREVVVQKPLSEPSYLLQKMQAQIELQKALIRVHSGESIQSTLDQAKQTSCNRTEILCQSNAEYRELMRRAMKALEKDVTLNVLTESVLCVPSLVCPTSIQTSHTACRPSFVSTATKSRKAARPTAKKPEKEVPIQDGCVDLLCAAKETLLQGQGFRIEPHGTVDTHAACAMQLDVSTLLSAISNPGYIQGVDTQTQSLAVDLPRIVALDYERQAVTLDELSAKSPEFLTWPHAAGNRPSAKAITAPEFQENFVDILPTSWTAVSLCLSEDASELYIARYNAVKSPLILRLPFSRHKPDDIGEETFDYHKGKAELQEVIDLSNYSCHNPGDAGNKALKTKWWNERKALDSRLHELLLNIEDIWLGGFKGVFAPCVADSAPFTRFGKSFEEILDRYLPSRNASKQQKDRPTLTSNVLELFIGLGDDDDGGIDLDEPLADLLYFVVDMLQFSGERNAYDEIDFDGMTVAVLDALRTYHESRVTPEGGSQHLVLVLDRRLQALPWESLPCLEERSVSRVGSMLSLRERILAQRASVNESRNGGRGEECRIPAAGTYILNPSSDLPQTQAWLEPTLASMGSAWNSVVNQVPSEDDFASAITGSSIMLYFGHGAGSQYIRPRTIRRLGSCCDVAWLMGCSSGAITEYGDLEPAAVPLAYMLAGTGQKDGADQPVNICKAVVATLWDVTDKDIDRFSLRLGEEWGLWPASEQSRLPTTTPRNRRIAAAAPTTPQRVPKTPKTPKFHKSPAVFKTPGRDRTRPPRQTAQKLSLVEAVSRSREACYLRYLNGAAPVVYGIPVYLED